MALWAIFPYDHLNGHRDDDELMIEGEEGGKGAVRTRALAPFDTDPNFDLVLRPKRAHIRHNLPLRTPSKQF